MMRTFYKMFFPLYIFIALTKITSVCASAKAMTPQLTPSVGSTVNLQWKTNGVEWFDFSLRRSGFTFRLADVRPFDVSLLPDTRQLFGRRLLIVYNMAENLFTATLKDIRYNEDGTFDLGLVNDFTGFSKFGNSTIRITSVLGSARFCMKPLETQYTVNENDVLKFKHNICGNPKPILKWKLGEDAMFESSFNSTLINDDTKQYSYVSETQPIKRKYCGRKITFKATNEDGSAEKSYKLDVNFTPSSISVISKHVHNDSCVQLFWPGDDTGKCVVTYHFQLDEGDIYNTTSTYFTLCNSTEVFYVSIWISYKGVVGDKSKVELAKISTTKSTANNKEELQDNNQRMSTVIITASISLVVTLVLIIVILVILIYKGLIVCHVKYKKRQLSVKTTASEEYEVNETEFSNYAVLNTKKIGSDEYADLVGIVSGKIVGLTSSNYTDLKLQGTIPSEYADLNTTESSKECKEVKLNNTKNCIYYNAEF